MRYFEIDELNKTINFDFPKDDDIIRRIKDCDFNARFNPELLIWIVPVNIYSKGRIINIIQEYQFKQRIAEVRQDVVVDYGQNEIDYAYLQGLCDSKNFTYSPRNYQLEALGYCRKVGSLINGDDVGLGKTFEAIIYAEVTNSFPCIVFVPATVKEQWKKEWIKIANNKNRTVSTIRSKPLKSRPNDWSADVVIINYDIIGKKQGKGTSVKFDELLSTQWKMAICDEAHYLKDKKAQRSSAMKMITKKIDLIQLLTGTAVMSKPSELWNLLVLIKRDHLIAKDWHQYIRRYCGGYRGKFGWVSDGATNIIELNEILRKTCYLRREKKDVLSELPRAIKQVIEIDISNKKEIDKATENFIDYVRETQGDEKADKAMEAEHLVAIGMLRKLSAQGKLKEAEKFLREWKDCSKPKLVFFGIHREQLIYLSEKFSCPIIAGGTSSENKQIIKEEWIASDAPFLFINIGSGGTGLDGLQSVCSNMAIYELPWRPSDIVQVIGRLERSGQTVPPNIYFLLNFSTIDHQMWEMLKDKEAVTEAVNKGIDVRRQKSGLRAVIQKLLKK